MENVFVVIVESDGKHWERDAQVNVFKDKERAEAYLKEVLEDARYDVQEECDVVEIESSKPDSFEVQGDDYEYWVTGYVSEKPLE